MQGAVAVEGEAHLWRPGRRGGPPSAKASQQDGAAPQDAGVQQQDAAGVWQMLALVTTPVLSCVLLRCLTAFTVHNIVSSSSTV